MRWAFMFVAACGGSVPPPTPPAVRVEPVAIAPVDARPKCVEPSEVPPPKWVGTYPKVMPRLGRDESIVREKALRERNPDIDAVFLDEHGFMNGFTTPKVPYAASELMATFLGGRDVLADARGILEELRCTNPDIAHFEATHAYLSRAASLAFVTAFERKHVFDDLVRDEPLPKPLDDDALVDKWKIGVEVARVHKLVVHHPGSIEKRVPVGKVSVPKKYLKVTVTRAGYRRAAGFELRLIARLEVVWTELQADIITPRFGATLEPQLTGNFQEVFDAVTGDAFNP